MLQGNVLMIFINSFLEAMLILMIAICPFPRLAENPETIQSNIFIPVFGLLFSQSVIIVFFFCQYIVRFRELFAPDYFYLYFIIVNILLPVFTITVINRLVLQLKHQIESQTQLDTLGKVKELLLTMREQRHNFRQELQVVYGLLEVEEFQAAQDYLKKSVSEVTAASEMIKTDNLGITALLYAKTGLADARKINLHVTVQTSLRKLSMDTRDINLVLGNLIDNALEAAQECSAPERIVEVFILQNAKDYIFEVRNLGATILPDISGKIFQAGFSTKGKERGLGLYSIKKLVYKYHGNIQVTSDRNGTCFRITIPAEQAGLQAGTVSHIKSGKKSSY
ncbi:DenW|uniref:Sensor_kinase_SpoOB-type, alpha-helical domain n=1 Tax=Dendrosporobacter quercicolus TaxID=146817 RepID=A0A1G9P136_9FIRM|nr:GHKL domain-containing protein [Dendrosporobacter quercicolus]NSL47507.1 DenW [Dendrosporobacter quercicolus DSM 1736]SDL92263.1 Sensor_kinase_SpoOB-type, alpha-helical domain [Dendrosporobacter quercicolus]